MDIIFYRKSMFGKEVYYPRSKGAQVLKKMTCSKSFVSEDKIEMAEKLGVIIKVLDVDIEYDSFA